MAILDELPFDDATSNATFGKRQTKSLWRHAGPDRADVDSLTTKELDCYHVATGIFARWYPTTGEGE